MRLSALSVAVLISLAASHVHAAESEAVPCRDDNITCLDRIQVTATKRPESTLDVPAATTIISAKELRESTPQTVMDHLHGAIGTFVQQTTPGQGVVIVRGLKGSEVLHLVDGFRLNNAIFRNAPNQYIALVDSQNLSQLEVVRGPSSMLYGSDAMGGVVHMLTREPNFTSGDWDFNGRYRFIYGSADSATIHRAEFATGRDRVAISGGATYQDVHDLTVGGGDRLRPTGFTARGGDFKLRSEISEGHELMFSAQYSKQPRTARYDALVPGFNQTRADNALFFFEPQERRFAQLRWKITQPNALFDAGELHLGRQDIIDDRRTRASMASGSLPSSNEDHEQNSDELTGFFGQFGKALGESHYLSYGFEAYADKVKSSKQRVNLRTGAVTTRDPRFPNGASMDSQALYVSDDWRIGERVDLNIGARYSRFDIEIPAIASAGLGDVKLSPRDLTGNIGVNIKLAENLRLVSNLGRGFRAPNIFDIGLFGERPGGRFNLPNADIKPESVITWDAGFKFGSDHLAAEFIAFRSRYTDKITSVETGRQVVIDDRTFFEVHSENVTELNMWGIEAGGRWHLPKAELYASATYTRGDEVKPDGSEMPADRIPPLFGKAGAVWHANDHLDLEAYTLYASRQARLSDRDKSDPRVNPDGTAGWATLNARVGWKATDAFSLALRIENLADKRYREHGTGLDEPGRNFILSADYRFY